MTRLEKIIAGMTPDAVADFLDVHGPEILPEPMPYCRPPKSEACAATDDDVELPCRECILAWLTEEVEA